MTYGLNALLHGLDVQHYAEGPVPGGLPYVDVAHVLSDARNICPGDMFVSLSKDVVAVATYVEQALDMGAQVILLEQGVVLPKNLLTRATHLGIHLLQTLNTSYAFSRMAAYMYSHLPETLVAVTGTNGKSSVASFVRQIWSYAGFSAAYWGTVGLEVGGRFIESPSALTTPDAMTLGKTLESLAQEGVTHVSLEASSHGLEQHRLSGICVKAAGFTQLSQDHLDYHGTMENYFEAKTVLFKSILSETGIAVLNADVPEYRELKAICQKRNVRVMDYGYQAQDLSIQSIVPIDTGYEVSCIVLEKEVSFSLPLQGDFQVHNSLCALGLALATGVPLASAIEALNHLKSVTGRVERVGKTPHGATVFVDYAHTPDALANVLRSLRSHTRGKLWVVFGCGGDRDTSKRGPMGAIAEQGADGVIVTDDNPRSEDPAAIRAQIMLGCGPKAREIPGRLEAIKAACEAAEDGDVIVIAGKGHEKGQIVGDEVFPFDDIQVAKDQCVSESE